MTFAILIELPYFIKQELSRICMGLPSTEWQTEENLCINLRSFKKLTDHERWDIADQLGEIDESSFSLRIVGINYLPKRGNTGILRAVLDSTNSLTTLKKKIDRLLRSFHQNNSDSHSLDDLTIHLGRVQNESPQRLASYLEANEAFKSSPFNIQEFVLAKIHQTEKRNFYIVEKRFFLS